MSFLAPLFLLGVLAVLVPVVLHLIHRQKALEVPFSTLRFLRASVRRTQRRKYFDDVALLVVRAAALAVLAVGLAGPVLTSFYWARGGAGAVVIILDNSGSMALSDAGQPRLETARRAAENVLDGLGESVAAALLPTGGPPMPEYGQLTRSHETVRQALAQCPQSHERADIAAKLRQARELLAASDTANREIYVITDNQKISWDGLEGPTDGRRQVPVVVVNVAVDPAPNVALRAVRLDSLAPAPGVPVTIRAEVFNASGLPQQRHVELHLDGRKEATSPTLTVPPQGSVWHEFQLTAGEPGAHRGELRLAEEDGCPADDRRYFALALDAALPVAVVKPRRSDIAYIDDAFYLERALAPARRAWSIRSTSLTPADLAGERLGEYRIVFLVNLPPPELAAAERLRTYVEAGGHLVWICGNNVDATAYNRLNDKAGGRLLPAPLLPCREPAGPKKESWSIAALDRDHPALAPLTEPASLYRSVLVHKHFPVRVDPESGVRVLARLSGGQPLLVERTVGAGSVLLLGTGAHVEWTNLPLKPLFLPLVARLTFHLAGAQAAGSQLTAGAPLSVVLPSGLLGDTEVVRPSGEVLRLRSEGGIFHYADTHEPGVYIVRLSDPKHPRQWAFAVNGDPAESDPETLSREELAQRFGEEPLLYCETPQDVQGAIRRLREGQSLWELFLGLVLAGLVLEAYLSNCRGRKPEAGRQLPAPGVRSSPGHQATPIGRELGG
jgi:hypothetical protein